MPKHDPHPDRGQKPQQSPLDYGFWHLGNFAHDYRELFGQSPSDTLVLAQAGRNRRKYQPPVFSTAIA
jgi:hypothetical protein